MPFVSLSCLSALARISSKTSEKRLILVITLDALVMILDGKLKFLLLRKMSVMILS